MIAYNNQGIKLLPCNAPVPLYYKKYALHKTWGIPCIVCLLNASWAIYRSAGTFKREGL